MALKEHTGVGDQSLAGLLLVLLGSIDLCPRLREGLQAAGKCQMEGRYLDHAEGGVVR